MACPSEMEVSNLFPKQFPFKSIQLLQSLSQILLIFRHKMAEINLNGHLSKKFCIVKFFSHQLEKTVVSAVPSSWVTEESECSFPADLIVTKKVRKLIESQAPAAMSWPVFVVEVLTSAGM